MAARTYFGTHAPDLTVTQSAMLVAMLKGPNLYNPVRHPEAATARRDLVLRLMAAQGKIDPVVDQKLCSQRLAQRLNLQ